MSRRPTQTSLFDDGATSPESSTPRPPADTTRDRLEAEHESARAIAARLPSLVRCGTSSWSFPGWAGLVYSRRSTAGVLARSGLIEYAGHPLFRTVGIDRSYYAPIPRADLEAYAAQLPAGFACCAKAPASVTSAIDPSTRGRAARPNADFLSPGRFEREMLDDVAAVFADHAGPFIVECAPVPRDLAPGASEFAERLERFLEALPRTWSFAIELRDSKLLTPEYGRVLVRRGAGHVYNAWSAMPSPGRQARLLDPADLPFVVIRWLLRPGTRYEDQRARFEPFDRLVEPDVEMRDEVVELLRAAVGRAQPAWLLVNNKAEGSSPITIREVARRLVEVLTADGPPATLR